jgi:hypothetical protein
MTSQSRIASCLLFSALLLTPIVSAQDGLALMKVDPGARPSGMGAAFVSISGDPNATAFNPAGVTGVTKFSAAFSHSTYWENIRLENGFFASPLKGRWYVHGGIRYATIDNLEMRNSPVGVPQALFAANDASFKFGVAYRVSDRVSAGLASGWLVEKIEAWKGSSMNFDLGIQAVLRPELRVGASVTDLGSSFTLSKAGEVASREISLPTTWRVGGSYQYRKYLGALDVVVLDDQAHLHVGAEARVHEMLQVRAGFMSGYDSKNVTAGVSFSRSGLRIDYAFVPYTHNLGTSHIFSFIFEL